MDIDYLEMPFELIGKHILLQVNIDGIDEPFIFDSGAPQIVLNKAYEVSTDEETVLEDVRGATGQIGGIQTTSIPALDWGALHLTDQPALIIDISHLETQLKTKVRGLIGFDTVKDFDIIYDYGNQKLVLINPSKTNEYVNWEYVRQPLLFGSAAHLPILPVDIAGKIFNMALDCGAEMNLMDANHHEFIMESGVFRQTGNESLTGIENAVSQVEIGELGPVSIGSEIEFETMKFLFADISHLNAASDIQIDGIVGYELLSTQKTIVSYARRELLIFGK